MTNPDTYFEVFGWKIERVIDTGDILTMVSVIIAAVAVSVSLRSFRKTVQQGNQDAKSAHYSELDRFYSDLLTLSLTFPFLRSPATIEHDDEALREAYIAFPAASEDDRLRYESYVLMVWNFIEAIHDRCQDLLGAGDIANYNVLRGTWEPIIRAENRIHRPWFLAEVRRIEIEQAKSGEDNENCHKFCIGFRIFVLERQWNEASWAYREKFSKPIDFGLNTEA